MSDPINTIVCDGNPYATNLDAHSVLDDPFDPINPAYYKVGGAELLDIIEQLPYNRGAAVKYLVRAGETDPAKHAEDLRKALRHVQRELDRIEGDTHE